MKRYKETNYFVTEDGRVYSEFSKRFLKPQKRGYLCVDLGKGNQESIHRMVAWCYCPNPNNYKEVNHKDGNKFNNHYTNLEWCTRKQNAQHGVDTGLIPRMEGELNGHAIVNEEQVKEMRKLYESKTKSYTELAKMYGVKPMTSYYIVTRRSWKHVK